MTFDSIILAAIRAELNTKLNNGRVDGVHSPSPLDLVLTIRANGANHILLISAEAKAPRIHLTSVKRPNPKTPSNFCMLMRKYLSGARLCEIEQIDFDRILHLKFATYDGELVTLVVEIMGKHSNIILISADGRILGAVKPVGRTKNRYREILPGKDYIAPPSQNKINPLSVADYTFSELLAGAFPGEVAIDAIASWLTKTFTGVSPFAAKELASRCQGDLNQLKVEFREFFSAVRDGDCTPVLFSDDLGRTVGYYAFPSVQFPFANQHERPSINLVADVYYNTELPRESFEQAKGEFIVRLQKELEAHEHALSSIEETLEECAGSERLKQIGELILSQMAAIPAEAHSAVLVDYYDPNASTVEVDLDPQLNPSENAEKYFRKYRKAVSGAEVLKDRLIEAQSTVNQIRRTLDEIDGVKSEEQIEQLQEMLASQGIRIRKKEEIPSAKRKPEFEGHRISKIESNGWEILIGQNSEANDYLLVRVAKPNDYWVHVKASPSAHVIIRTNNKPNLVPIAIIHEAAEQAAKHSDSKHSSLVPVDYTLRKYVRKPKGAPAGKALYVNEKTLYITPNL